jgi:hypothetical protein
MVYFGEGFGAKVAEEVVVVDLWWAIRIPFILVGRRSLAADILVGRRTCQFPVCIYLHSFIWGYYWISLALSSKKGLTLPNFNGEN